MRFAKSPVDSLFPGFPFKSFISFKVAAAIVLGKIYAYNMSCVQRNHICSPLPASIAIPGPSRHISQTTSSPLLKCLLLLILF